MSRRFNTAGPCRGDDHYMLPAAPRLARVRPLIEAKAYFVVHAPRQSGKTTSAQSLADALTAEGSYAALLASCKVGSTARNDVERGVRAVVYAIAKRAREKLPEDLQPEPPELSETVPAEVRLETYLTRWCESCPRPVVLFLDEIDALFDDTLLCVLSQLHSGYGSRPEHFPHAMALIGLRDVRDYKIETRNGRRELGSSSPFNIKSDSLTLANFTSEEVAELYEQHPEETGQGFTPAAKDRVFELTRGQPWLVNALARQLVEVLVPERSKVIEAGHVDEAAELLIERRDTHLDSLLEKLREERVERVIAPILAGEIVLGDRLDDDMAYVEDLGLVTREAGQLEIANPIYHEVIPRVLASGSQYTIPHRTEWYLTADGRLDMDALLKGFFDFWREHGEAMLGSQPYKEVAFQLLVMSFLQRVTNGGGWIHREYALGRGRTDLVIHWPHGSSSPREVQREVLELKVWRDKKGDPLEQGLEQLGGYLESLGLDHGALLIFDRRSNAAAFADRSETSELVQEGRRIRLLRL